MVERQQLDEAEIKMTAKLLLAVVVMLSIALILLVSR
jgi:hypothetical protein